jgi:hypothetical protein
MWTYARLNASTTQNQNKGRYGYEPAGFRNYKMDGDKRTRRVKGLFECPSTQPEVARRSRVVAGDAYCAERERRRVAIDTAESSKRTRERNINRHGLICVEVVGVAGQLEGVQARAGDVPEHFVIRLIKTRRDRPWVTRTRAIGHTQEATGGRQQADQSNGTAMHLEAPSD